MQTHRQTRSDKITEHSLRITHAERVIDPTSGITKGDLVQYYANVLPWILPHLRDRPVAMVRAPGGIAGTLFFQKHLEKIQIPNLTRHVDWDKGHPPVLSIDSADALMAAVQMNVVELHTWNGVVGKIDKPDRVIFDLDPDPALPWQRMRDAATLVRALLEEIGLQGFLKTSGGKGLHIVVPLQKTADWEVVFEFSKAVAEHLAHILPRQFSAKMGAQNRVDKIFVDYLRNHRGATSVSAYSARTRPGMGVSAPVTWDELKELQKGDEWTVETLPGRLARLEADPWADYGKVKQKLTAGMIKKLGE